MTKALTYLDYNATAPAKPAVVVRVAEVMQEGGNPSSVHAHGRAAHSLLEQARDQVARLVGAKPGQVTFTSGGTESNSLAILGGAKANNVERLVISATEHPSVREAAEASGLVVETLSCGQDGLVDPQELHRLLAEAEQKTMVSVMLANNETGIIQPIRALTETAREFGALVHCDAVQAAGKVEVDFAALGVDFLSLSSHKIAGPQGAGVLIKVDAVDFAARSFGGGQERSRRPGTENLSGLVGFGLAADLALNDFDKMADLAQWRDDLQSGIETAAPEAIVIGKGSDRLPNTLCVTLPGIPSETQVMALDLDGFCVSAGSACSSGKVARSHVLDAMGFDVEISSSVLRISLGWRTTQEEVDSFLSAWCSMRERLNKRQRSAVA